MHVQIVYPSARDPGEGQRASFFEVQMSLWVDRYRPVGLRQLSYHDSLTEQLTRLAESQDFPHLLVYGPPGVGKKTRITAVLRQMYGPGVEKVKLDQRVFTTPGGKKMELAIASSNYHIEVTPADDLIKEIAQTQSVDTNSSRQFKVVVLNEAHLLSRDAQHGLRRTMENRIIGPIRSRCLLIRVPSPSSDEICTVLQSVAEMESINLPDAFARQIAGSCKGNLRRGLLMLEAAKIQQYPFIEGQQVVKTDWEAFVGDIATIMVDEQSPARLLAVRGKLYELLSHCIPADVVLKTLTFELLLRVDDAIKPEILKHAAEYDHRLRLGSKSIFHLEAFVAKFFAVYKKFLLDLMDDI
ncbi:MAG: hypothetical protein SGCHY_004626 [Lobulomycetales sp.]